METDVAYRTDAPAGPRLAAYVFEQFFGHRPLGVWSVPAMITLLAQGDRRLDLGTRFGALVAASLRPDGLIEPVLSSRPDERVTLTIDEAASGRGTSWMGEGLRHARVGASLFVSIDLPQGAGIGTVCAGREAIRLTLQDLATAPERVMPAPAVLTAGMADRPPAAAVLDGRRVPFDLTGAGLRLVIIDPRVRGTEQCAMPEHTDMDAVAQAVQAGALARLGPMLTAAHAELVPDEVQEIAVRAALAGGALGARMITDGPGRPVCALVPIAAVMDVRTAVSRAFAARGLRAPRVLAVTPSADLPRRVA
jgi:hypothetical protein